MQYTLRTMFSRRPLKKPGLQCLASRSTTDVEAADPLVRNESDTDEIRQRSPMGELKTRAELLF